MFLGNISKENGYTDRSIRRTLGILLRVTQSEVKIDRSHSAMLWTSLPEKYMAHLVMLRSTLDWRGWECTSTLLNAVRFTFHKQDLRLISGWRNTVHIYNHNVQRGQPWWIILSTLGSASRDNTAASFPPVSGKRERLDIEVHPNCMNEKGDFFLSILWIPLICSLQDRRKPP